MRFSAFLAGVSLLSAAFIATPEYAGAVPARPGIVEMTMPDGSKIEVTIHGDEHFHFYTTTDGHMLLADESGFLCYATEQGGSLRSSGIRAHSATLRTESELAFIRSLGQDGATRLRSAASRLAADARRAPARANGQFSDLFTAYPTLGSPRGLVLLLEFPDQKFVTPDPLEAFTALMTQKGYSRNGATGSATDYFTDCSRGLFTPRFDVYGPVTVPGSMAYYGRESGFLHDVDPYQMIADACMAADDMIDFSIYDEDHDGWVDNVFVFYAGYGQNSGAPSETIWPHAANIWTYAGIKLVLDGVQIGNYACTNEIKGTSGNAMTGIGTFCHEFSHVLGLPDLYATDGSSSFTPGHFEVMDVGPYLNDGNTPPYLSTYDRACLRWINPRELTVGETVTLQPFEGVKSPSDDEALIISTPVNENEYYLLENRQQTGWDSYIPGHGMLVWHIDYDPQIWKDNKVNSPSRSQHLRVDIVEADGVASSATRAGDPFPGTSNVTSFTDNTIPSMRTWANIRVEKPLTNIHEQDGVISFDILGGGSRIEPVEALAATEVRPLSFRTNWQGRSDIYNYEIDLFNADEAVPAATLTKQTQSLADCSIEIDGLTPSTRYSYVVRAVSGERKSPSSNRVSVATADPTFDMLRASSLPAAEIGADCFTARWEEMKGAAAYELSVYTKQTNLPTTETCDFSDGLDHLPEGWYTNSSATSGMAGTYGTSRPSLRLAANNEMLRTPAYNADINGISFWVKASSATEGELTVSGLTDGSWQPIATLNAADFIAEGRTVSLGESTPTAIPEGCRSIQIAFARKAGSVYIDDVTTAYNGAVAYNHIPGYEARNVGSQLSHRVDGLKGGATYHYTVKAIDADGLRSLPSPEISVTVGSDAIYAIAATPEGIGVTSADGRVVLTNTGSRNETYRITTPAGAVADHGSVAPASTAASHPLAPGVYMVSSGSRAVKVVVR